MFKQLIVISMIAACPAFAAAQTCHAYLLPATLHRLPYAQYAAMARAENLRAPATEAAHLARADALQKSLCALDKQADAIGPLPDTFHYEPSDAQKVLTGAMSPQALQNIAEHGATPAQQEKARTALQHPLTIQMTLALITDVDYRQQAMAARYTQARKPVPDDLNATVQDETLQAIQTLQEAGETSDSHATPKPPARP